MNGQIRYAAHLAAAGLGLYLCFRLALPFLAPLTWALGLAIVLHPLCRRVEPWFPRHGIASLVIVGAAAAIAGFMVIIVGQQVVREAASGAAHMDELVRRWDSGEIAQSFPRIASALAWLADRFEPAEPVARIGQWLTEQSTSVVRGSISQVIVFALTFYFLFYFLRDGDRLLATASARLPAERRELREIAGRVTDAVKATVRGTILVAFVQGALGGLIFWLLGLPAPAFWGLVMALLAIVPVLGAFVVWIPAAIFLALDGQWASALVLGLWGGVVIAGIDNLLYPVFVGTQLRLHTLVVFIGAVGGLTLFGAPGVILGPVIIVATQSLLASVLFRDDERSAISELDVQPAPAVPSTSAGSSPGTPDV